jgi:carbon-monoxide dehydrogenase small subunit
VTVTVRLRVNGASVEAGGVWEGESLLRLLRHHLDLKGTKNACEQGECGSCTVLLDGDLVCACLVAAVQADGSDVITIEGAGDLAPLQAAFLDCGAVQCGFCTPGLVMAAADLLRRRSRPTEAEVREALAGNLCRCTGYQKVIDAVLTAAADQAGDPLPVGGKG